MYQAIQVKYLPCTNTLGTRVKATAAAGSVTLAYDYALGVGQNAEAAMLELVNKFGLDEYPATWQGGVLPSGDYVFVRLPEGAKK
ncbi:hypothetical protein vBAspATola_12 [Aeromonas phage vB_AspA_Tola]|nr:hypothetical protein vBAspATola_12 [Aeromonas phage vB_AspA_Tola]